MFIDTYVVPDRVGSRSARKRVVVQDIVCRLPAGRRESSRSSASARRRIVHRSAADRGTGVRAGLTRFSVLVAARLSDRLLVAAGAARVGATLLGLGVLLTALAICLVIDAAAVPARSPGRRSRCGWRCAKFIGPGNRSVRSGVCSPGWPGASELGPVALSLT